MPPDLPPVNRPMSVVAVVVANRLGAKIYPILGSNETQHMHLHAGVFHTWQMHAQSEF